MVVDELAALLARHARPDGSTPIDGVVISRVEQPTPPAVSMSGTVFSVIAQGAKTMFVGSQAYEYRAGQYTIACVDLPVTGQYTEAPAAGLGIALEPAAIAELLLDVRPEVLPRRAGPAPLGVVVSDAPDHLLDAVIRLVRLLDQPRDIPVLAPLIKKEILWRLITGEQGAIVRQFGLADSSLTQIARAVRWIREHYAERFLVEELARSSGMSPSAFHRHFQMVTGMSPIRFQKEIRLQEARLLLATQPTDVTAVAYRVGYESAAQFSRDYRRQFGMPPSRDAAQLRRGRRSRASIEDPS